MGKEFASFIGARLATLVLENGILFVLIDLFAMNNMIAKFIGQVAVIVSNYILSKIWIFKKKES